MGDHFVDGVKVGLDKGLDRLRPVLESIRRDRQHIDNSEGYLGTAHQFDSTGREQLTRDGFKGNQGIHQALLMKRLMLIHRCVDQLDVFHPQITHLQSRMEHEGTHGGLFTAHALATKIRQGTDTGARNHHICTH